MDEFVSVRAQIVIDLELKECSVNGTQLDLLGLSTEVKNFLENLPMSGPEMRIHEVSSPTKGWEIASQLNYGQEFVSPQPDPSCKCTMTDRMIHSIECPLHWRKAPHSRACGFRNHEHGLACSTNCPSCQGKQVQIPEGGR